MMPAILRVQERMGAYSCALLVYHVPRTDGGLSTTLRGAAAESPVQWSSMQCTPFVRAVGHAASHRHVHANMHM